MIEITLEAPGRFTSAEVEALPADAPLAPGWARVRVHRIGVCGTDWHAFAGRQPFFSYPRVLGHELGVEVTQVAPGAPNPRGIALGDRCCVEPYLNCGRCIACRSGKPNCCESLQVLGVHTDGGMRGEMDVPLEKLHRANELSFDQLALVETLCIGAHAVGRARVEPGETVLVIGAGPIGLSVIQFLSVAGARILVMDISDERLEFCRRVADIAGTINPKQGEAQGEAEALIRAQNLGELPTCVMDATGNPASMMGTFERAAHGGRIVFVGLFVGEIAFEDSNFHRRELTLSSSRNATPQDFERTLELLKSGRIDTTPWITHRMALAEVGARFSEMSRAPGLVKAMVEV